MRTIALIDYGSGNLHSAERALKRAAEDDARPVRIAITSDPNLVLKADGVVLPGVGHFADCAANLRAVDGMIEALNEAVITDGKPFFGICVGAQLLATRGLEDGDVPGLDWISGTVDRIEPGTGYPIPHMGWNNLNVCIEHPILRGLGEDPHVYFTHSYAFRDAPIDQVVATTEYGETVIAAVARDNIFATQFHPEKSQRTGLKILSNFISWSPS